jgi:hypothetical protein
MGKCTFIGQTLKANKDHLFSNGYGRDGAKGGPLAEEPAFKAKTPQAKMGMQT